MNELDPFAAEWLGNLYPAATIDKRSIKDVAATDVRDFRRVHFFAGIGGWELALQLAGWPDEWPVWTGSCPCQPFSAAGKRKGEADERHLWPEFFRLIDAVRPPCVLGEQVAGAGGLEWWDGVSTDLAKAGYTTGAINLGAHSVSAPHIRQRLFWVAFTGRASSRNVGRPNGQNKTERKQETIDPARRGANGGVEHSATLRRPRSDRPGEQEQGTGTPGPWSDYRIIPCLDGEYRRISSQSGDEPLAYGVPRDMGSRFPELRELAKGARGNRVGRLRGYGNAIVPQVAAVFVKSVIDCIGR